MSNVDSAVSSHFSFQVSWHSARLSEARQLFLSCTPRKEHGPGIDRDGVDSPRMINAEAPWDAAWKHPENLRRCSWAVGDPEATNEWDGSVCTSQQCKYLTTPAVDRVHRLSGDSEEVWKSDLCPGDHCAYFRYLANGKWTVEAVEGCGNLSMNMWFVAYRRPMELDGERTDVRQTALIYLLDEGRRFSDPSRKYSCLVKWRRCRQGFPRMSIRDLRFNAFDRASAVHIDHERDGPPRNITEDVEFAVFGQQVIRDGRAVDLGTITHQFSDVRHLFRLPNLRPSFPKYGLRDPDADIWFGEAELLEDADTRRGALSRPALLKMFHKGGPYVPGVVSEKERDVVADAFQAAGYVHVPEGPPRRPGEFRFDPASNDLVDVWLIPNVYSYSFIGLGGPDTRDGEGRSDRLVVLAASGASGRQGLTLRTAIDKLRTQAGAYDALLIDEGLDVFQWVHGDWLVPVPPPFTDPETGTTQSRDRLRTVFILATQEGNATDAPTRGRERST